MKPTNKTTSPCTPISSNCVIWDGPDIPCLTICNGDTISDITYGLAKELCLILDYLDVKNYDLTCFNLQNCGPENFKDLIQLIINRICALENIPVTTTGTGCPDCLVNIAPCFVYNNPANGDPVTQLQLTDYVSLIGLQVCKNIADIALLQQAVASLQANNGNARVLQTTPTPQVIPYCVLPAIPTDINLVLAELEKQFCLLRTATGDTTEIYTSLTAECVGLATDQKLSGSGTMNSIPGWVVKPSSLADSFKNMWLTICDLRSAVKNIQLNCCPSGCNGIQINMQVIKEGTGIRIFFTGTVPTSFSECNPIGTLFTITDTTNGFITTTINVKNNLNINAGYYVELASTPVNQLSDLNINATLCMVDSLTGTTCQSILNFDLVSTANCPTVIYTPSLTTIGYSFSHTGGSAVYILELWDATLSNLLQVQSIPVNTPQNITGTFSALTPGTTYNFKLKIVVGERTTICPISQQSTNPNPCPAPSNVSSQLTIN